MPTQKSQNPNDMKNFGYSSLAVVAGVAALAVVGTTTYIAVTNPEPIKNMFSVSQTSSATPSTTNTPPLQGNADVLSVTDVTSNKAAHVGRRVRIAGDLRIHVMYSEKPCATDEPTCDTSMGARFELWQSGKTAGDENMILLFKNNSPYPCTKNAPGVFSCGAYRANGPATIEGVWSKGS